MKTPPFPKPTEKQFAAAAELVSRDCFARGPANTEIREAIHTLNRRLVDNATLYLRGDLQDQRDAVADTLLAVEGFLADQGLSRLALFPILRPVEALVERENNTIDPLFAERVRDGKPKRTLDKLNRIGILAGLADAWLDAHAGDGRSPKLLLDEATRTFKGRWFKNLTRAQLRTARDLVREESADHPSVEQARRTRADIERTAELYGPQNAIAIMVRYLNECPPSFAFGNLKILETPAVSPSGEG
jgi:hypothetical protein